MVEGATAPTEQDALELFAPYQGVPPALAKPTDGAVQATPPPTAQPTPAKPAWLQEDPKLAPQGGVTPKAPTFRDMVTNPVSTFASKPIASYLPQGVQDFLAQRSIGAAPAIPEGVGAQQAAALDPSKVTPSTNYVSEFLKGVAEKVNPGQVAAGVGTAIGGPIGLAANTALGVQGGLEASDPERSPAERIMGGVNALGGLAGVAPILAGGKAVPSFPKATPRRIALTPETEKLQDAFELAMSKKDVAYPKQLDADFKLAMEGKDAQFKVRAAASAESEAAAKARRIMEHFNTLDPESAAAEAKQFGLAQTLQKLDEVNDAARVERIKVTPPPPKAPKVKIVEPTPPVDEEEVLDAFRHATHEKAAGIAQSDTKTGTMSTRELSVLKEPGGNPPDPVLVEHFKKNGVTTPITLKLRRNGNNPGSVSIYGDDYGTSGELSIHTGAEILAAAKAAGVKDIPVRVAGGLRPQIDPATISPFNKLYDKATGKLITPKPTKAPTVDEVMFTPEPPKEGIDVPKGGNPAQALMDKLGPLETPKTLRTDDVLRSNPRFQALSKEERAARYKELGGLDAEAKKVKVPEIDPSTLYSGFDPTLALAALKKPGVRAALGGALGYSTAEDDEHPFLRGLAGAGAGVLAAPSKYGGMAKGLEHLNAARYEALLSGAPQLSNLAGNAGGAAAAPILEALRGNLRGAGQLAKSYTNIPQVVSDWLSGAGEGWRSADKITRFGKPVEVIGPAGKALRAVDQGTKKVLAAGGLSKDLAGHYTLSAEPSTDIGKWLVKGQTLPGAQLVAPFVRTAVKAAEMGAATSPLRWSPKLGENLREMLPAQEYVTSGGHKISKKVFEGLLGLLAPAAGYAGLQGEGPKTALGVAGMGPMAAPYAAGKGIRDYAKYGKTGDKDVAEALSNELPLIGDIPKTIREPRQFLTELPSQFLPQFLMMAGDKTVRDASAGKSGGWAQGALDEAENKIKAKLPIARESLPAKRTFLGDPKVRNILGQYPEADYNTDPTAARLSDAGVLRRSPNQSLGGVSTKAQLLLPEGALEKLNPEMRKMVESLTTFGNDDLSPMEASRLGELRGKATRYTTEQVMKLPGFQALPKPKQDLLLKLLASEGSSEGTKYFKAERTVKARSELK